MIELESLLENQLPEKVKEIRKFMKSLQKGANSNE